MADVQGFRAVRYSGAAGPLADLVAPPYDAISQEERERLSTRSPYNVVHLTLPDSVEHAGQLYRTWLSEGVLEREAEPAAWFIAEEYTGPDGVGRERRGIVASLAAEPYETGTVLPHERTYRRTKEERLQLLRETLVYPEPLFLLVDGPLGVDRPEAAPEVEVNGTRLWRLPDTDGGSLLGDAQLLIADGHHRYETAVAFGAEAPADENRVMALIVSTGEPGLHVFPTHRVFSGAARPPRRRRGRAGRRVSKRRSHAWPRSRTTDRSRSRTGKAAPRSCAGAKASSTSSSSTGTASTESRTRRVRTTRSRQWTRAKRTLRTSCASPVSKTSSPSRDAASSCPRRARTSSRSRSPAFSSIRSTDEPLARALPRLRR